MEEKMKKLILAFIIAAMGMFYSAAPADAFTQTTTGTMNIAATVLPTCTVATTPMDFGNLISTPQTYAISTITVNCSSGAPYRIGIDAGQNASLWALVGSPLSRTLWSGTNAYNVQPYDLFQDAALTTEWGDYSATLGLGGKSGIGTGAAQIHTVYGLAEVFDLIPGVYTDTVMVTVNY